MTKVLLVGYYNIYEPLYRISQSYIIPIMKAFMKIIPVRHKETRLLYTGTINYTQVFKSGHFWFLY